jgi:hypothetical protein
VLSLITADNLPGVLTAVGAVIAAAGGFTLYRVQKEPPKPGTIDAAAIALAENTKALLSQSDQFKANNTLFGSVLALLTTMAKDFADARRDIAEIRHDMSEAKAHLAAIRDALNRRP